MARDRIVNMIVNDSDSDDELEMLTIAAMQEEKLNSQRQSGLRRGSV